MEKQKTLLSRIRKLVQEKTGIEDLRPSTKRSVLTKMCIAYVASEMYGIPKNQIAKELNTSGRLIRYYVTTFPQELVINKEFRGFIQEINDHPDFNRNYFNGKCRKEIDREPEWNTWIENQRFMCRIGDTVIDPDVSKLKSEIIYRHGLRWIAWELIDLQDDAKIEFIFKNLWLKKEQ